MKGCTTLTAALGALFITTAASAEPHPALAGLEPMPSITAQTAEGMEFPLGYHDDRLYPLGFTREDKFAYVLGIESACGYCPAIILFDPVTDRHLDSEHFEEEGRQLDEASLNSVMARWEVEETEGMTLRTFPAEIDGHLVEAYLNGDELWLSHSGLGSKRIAEFSLPPYALRVPDSRLLIEGYYRTPSGKRIVIVLSRLEAGFEAEVSLSYHLAGAHLSAGFEPGGDPHPALSGLTPMPSRTSEHARQQTSGQGYFNDNVLYPLGFNVSGEFAYIVAHKDGGCGYCPNAVLFDPVTDRALERRHFEQEGRQLGASALTDIYQEWMLPPTDTIVLQRFPADIAGDRLEAYIEDDALWIHSGEQGRKKIADFSHLRQPMLWQENTELVIEGFYLSPVEARIVVIVSGLFRGFEGETDIRYYPVGAHLKDGYHSYP